MPAWGHVRSEKPSLPKKQFPEEWLGDNYSSCSPNAPYGVLPIRLCAGCWGQADTKKIMTLDKYSRVATCSRTVGTFVGGDQTSRADCPELMPIRDWVRCYSQ